MSSKERQPESREDTRQRASAEISRLFSVTARLIGNPQEQSLVIIRDSKTRRFFGCEITIIWLDQKERFLHYSMDKIIDFGPDLKKAEEVIKEVIGENPQRAIICDSLVAEKLSLRT